MGTLLKFGTAPPADTVISKSKLALASTLPNTVSMIKFHHGKTRRK
jgi:hypothetical protein